MSKHKLWWVVLGAVVVLALVVAGTVVAQSPTPRPTPGAGFVDKDGDGVCDLCGGNGVGRGGRMGGMRGGMGLMMGGCWNGTTLIDTVAKALNISVADVQAELQQGKTLRKVIIAHNGNVDAIVKTFLDARKAALDTLVQSGRITQAQADQMLANMTAEVTEHLDEAGLTCGMGRRGTGTATPGTVPGGRGGMRFNRI